MLYFKQHYADVTDPRDLRQKSQSSDDLSIAGEDYQALSAKEEADLELLMSECQVAMSNAELFAEQLSKQLSVLDGVSRKHKTDKQRISMVYQFNYFM